MKKRLVWIALLFCTQFWAQTETDREALLDYIIDKTLEREAISPPKNALWGIDFATQAEALRQEFKDASTDIMLYRALRKLQALNKDSHLVIEQVSGGISLSANKKELPILLAPDFTKTPHEFFVFSKAEGFNFNAITNGDKVTEGDVLISVNGIDVNTFYNDFQSYFSESTPRKMDWELSEYLSEFNTFYPTNLFPNTSSSTFRFKKADNTEYDITLNYASNYDVKEPDDYSIPSKYQLVLRTDQTGTNSGNFELYRDSTTNTLLLNWLDLENGLIQDLQGILDYMIENNLLNTDMIFFAPFSSGGSGSQLVLSILSSYPYKTTFGNVKHSDFSVIEANSRGGAIRDWILRNEGTGDAYTSNEPFKLQYGSEYSDGVYHAISDENNRFKGNIVAVFSSRGGSNLDQLSAQIIQNGVAYSIGNPTGGYSNTYERGEVLRFDSSNAPVVFYDWNIGHTIRPDGQVLEGNPAPVDEMISMSSTNFNTYFDELIVRAETYLNNFPTDKPEFYLEDLNLGESLFYGADNAVEITMKSLSETTDDYNLTVSAYLSEDNNLDTGDIAIGTANVTLTGNQTLNQQLVLSIPDIQNDEHRFVMLKIDDAETVVERSEYNNLRFTRLLLKRFVDDDNDGIANELDNCPNTSNADQKDLDEDGIGDVCDDDIDGDGVLNDVDNCSNTPQGSPVDITGCVVFSLPNTNFSIEVIAVSCIGKIDGAINIQTQETYNYTVTMTGEDPIDFTDTATFSGLEAGEYELCFTLDEAPNYELCYNLTISAPVPLSVFSKVNTNDKTVTLSMEGGTLYTINLNGVIYKTSDAKITLPLSSEKNQLSVKTQKDCQGTYSDFIHIPSNIFIWPNPVTNNYLNIDISFLQNKEAQVSLYTVEGQQLINKNCNSNKKHVSIDMANFRAGIYIGIIETKDSKWHFKAIKQ